MEPVNTDQRDRVLLDVLRNARESAGLRQVDLAARLGVPQSYVSKYETSERRLSFVEVEDVAAALGLPFEELIRLYRESQHGAG